MSLRTLRSFLTKIGLTSLMGLLLLSPVFPALAAEGFLQGDTLKATTDSSGLAGANQENAGALLPVLVGKIINAGLGVLGILLLIYLLYGGFLWMTSGGESEGVKKAKTMITNAIVGLVIISVSAALSAYIISRLSTAVVK